MQETYLEAVIMYSKTKLTPGAAAEAKRWLPQFEERLNELRRESERRNQATEVKSSNAASISRKC
jgi:hypothetical protein